VLLVVYEPIRSTLANESIVTRGRRAGVSRRIARLQRVLGYVTFLDEGAKLGRERGVIMRLGRERGVIPDQKREADALTRASCAHTVHAQASFYPRRLREVPGDSSCTAMYASRWLPAKRMEEANKWS
jgi:hypothetical protein